MTLNKHTDGDVIYASKTNQDNNECLNISGLNLIRELIDRDIDFSAGLFDWWGDAYVDTLGQEDSVVDDMIETTAFPDIVINKKYSCLRNTAGTDTIHDPDSFTAPTRAFDLGLGISDRAYRDTGEDTTRYLGKTFTSKYVKSVYINAELERSSSDNLFIYLETYDGASWNAVATLADGSDIVTYNAVYDLDDTVSGIRIGFRDNDYTTSNHARLYCLAYGEIEEECLIKQNIPSGTFSSTMSSAIGVPFVEDWETGADIQYKLTGTGGAEDTGWLDAGITPELTSFTAFTAEPDTLIVKLVPKTTSPTSGFPSIRGFCIRAT